jgi:hypothetical protein
MFVIEAALAQAAVGFLATKAAEGVAKELGADAYKSALAKLKGFFSYKFAGRTELDEVHNNPSSLIALVTEQAAHDTAFKSDLKNLVDTLQKLTGESGHESTTYAGVDSVVNIDIGSASGSNISGRDTISGNHLSGGQNYVGGDQRGSTFR